MASIFRRKGSALWWVKFTRPAGGTARLSLETAGDFEAGLRLRRLEALLLLSQPDVAGARLPDRVLAELPAAAIAAATLPGAAPPPVKNGPVEIVLPAYLAWSRARNAPRHAASKEAMLRNFFGSRRVPRRPDARATAEIPAACRKRCLAEITREDVQKFIDGLDAAMDTRRHYREMMHQLWEFALSEGHLAVLNAHRPNPMSNLPSYTQNEREIAYLSEQEIVEQIKALESDPSVQMAVEIMIEAGLRRTETLWLRPRDINLDEDFLSVVTKSDPESEPEGRDSRGRRNGKGRGKKQHNKTGARPVHISPALQRSLTAYLPTVRGPWLIPSPDGKRWDADNFSSRLRDLNATADIAWTCLHFRHTFATRNLRRGVPVLGVAQSMGNSVQVVLKHYRGFIPPKSLWRV